MTGHPPKVSVLTPIYNTNPIHLRECIESILNQTFADFEFLILNDSPDNTEIEKIVKAYAKKDKRVRYVKNKKNLGITPSRNKLVKMARGQYLAIFDHDDISLPTRLEAEVKYLDEHPYIGVVSAWVQFFDESDYLLKNPEHDWEIKIGTTDDNVVPHTAAMIRKSVLIDNNIEYEELYSPAEDYRLWARLMGVTHFYNIQDVLVKYRWTSTNTSNNQKMRMHMARDAIRLYAQNNFPAYYKEWQKTVQNTTIFRLRLFGIPLLKIKNNTVYLFEYIPTFKIKWK
ncbi:MAG: glycosyltransferase [Alphaproteobacteria bacterium]|nr:glycosyltransferase [Alphaproteobacteria bacterium]